MNICSRKRVWSLTIVLMFGIDIFSVQPDIFLVSNNLQFQTYVMRISGIPVNKICSTPDMQYVFYLMIASSQ